MKASTGALNAFGMNKSDGGQQSFQNDTFFPPETKDEVLHRQVQEMTCMKDGVKVQKGLDRVLKVGTYFAIIP